MISWIGTLCLLLTVNINPLSPSELQQAWIEYIDPQQARTSPMSDHEIKTLLIRPSHPVYKRHSVELVGAGVGGLPITITVRKLYDHRTPMTEEELSALRDALFEAAGTPFDLQIETFTLNEKPSLQGTLTKKDEENHKILVVNEEKRFYIQDQSFPEAYWLSFTEDASFWRRGGNEPLQWSDLEEGQHVEVWSVGGVTWSYPGGMRAVELAITEPD